MIASNVISVIGLLAVISAFTFQAPGGVVESPFLCNLKALTAAERTLHLDLSARLLTAMRDRRETTEGYAFDFDMQRVTLKDLATWVEYERRCCPFFDFRLQWRRENGPVTLELAGRPGVKEFIRAEFADAFR